MMDSLKILVLDESVDPRTRSADIYDAEIVVQKKANSYDVIKHRYGQTGEVNTLDDLLLVE